MPTSRATEMHGSGTFFDARLNDKKQFPVAARTGSWNTRGTPDMVTAKLAALHFYQLAIPAPKPPEGSFDAAAAARGEELFNGKAKCATCHVPPLFTEPGNNLHAPARDRRGLLPGRPLADTHVPHRAARGSLDAPEGRLLP